MGYATTHANNRETRNAVESAIWSGRSQPSFRAGGAAFEAVNAEVWEVYDPKTGSVHTFPAWKCAADFLWAWRSSQTPWVVYGILGDGTRRALAAHGWVDGVWHNTLWLNGRVHAHCAHGEVPSHKFNKKTGVFALVRPKLTR